MSERALDIITSEGETITSALGYFEICLILLQLEPSVSAEV